MANIPNALESPRITDKGVICWYAGDTFQLNIIATLKNKTTGQNIEIDSCDTIEVIFETLNGKLVKTFLVTHIVNNTIPLVFDEEVTALFAKGSYKYSIHYYWNERTTIADGNIVEVE